MGGGPKVPPRIVLRCSGGPTQLSLDRLLIIWAGVLKLLLLSLLLCTFFLPAYAARGKNARQALWSLLGTMLLVELGYAVFLFLAYPRLL